MGIDLSKLGEIQDLIDEFNIALSIRDVNM